MHCTCGQVNPDVAVFCGACGERLVRTVPCGACGVANPPGQRFCNGCGARLGAPDPSPSSTGPGERKQATVLFADVVGSMSLAGAMDPEEWGELMKRFFAVLREGVNRFDGRVDKFTGDGVMALFGAPIAYEDHARRGCAAALYLKEALAVFGREVEADGGRPFVVRIGLNSGEVVAGPVGEDLKVEYTAVGNAVGLAQRMESLAQPGTVYLTPATATLVQGYFDLRGLGPMTAKGAEEPTAVFELVGPGKLSTPLEVAAARGFSRFVGRDQELAVLAGAFDQAGRGNGQVIGVVADPGVGKSRLCHEFAAHCRLEGAEVVFAHALAHTRSVPFVPVLEMLRGEFGISEQDEPATARERVTKAVWDLDPGVEDAVPLLWEFLGVPDPDRAAPTMDPEARQRQIFAALNCLRRARSERTQMVVVAEDLHWLDPGSEVFLESLVNAVPGSRLLVVSTFRPEYRVPWSHRAYYAQLPIRPLLDEARDELLADLVGAHPSLDGLAERVDERTAGNPFFIEETVQALVEAGSLVGSRGAYQLAGTIGDVQIPPTVQAVLAARLDRLAEHEKTLVHTAAVIGRRFSRRLVGRVSGLGDEDLRAALQTLVDGELLYQAGDYPEEEFVFKHALTEEVAYRSQLSRARAGSHLAIAQALCDLDADRLDERASLIARHYELGAEPLEAARWSARAATWAGYSEPMEAVRQWRRVWVLTGQLGSSPESSELRLNAAVMLLSTLWRLGAAVEDGPLRWEEEIGAVFSEAEALCDSTGRQGVKAALLAAYAMAVGLTGAVDQAYELHVRSVRLADETGDAGLRVTVRLPLMYTVHVQGRIREGARIIDETEEILGDDRSLARDTVVISPYAWCLMAGALFRGHFERLDECLALLETAVNIAGEEGDWESQVWAHRHFAVLADLAGSDPEVAAAHARRALEGADRVGGPFSRLFNRMGVAANHAQRSEWQAAIDTADEALAISRSRRIAVHNVPFLLATRARALIGLGHFVEARADADEAIAVAVQCGTRYFEAMARLELARALLAGSGAGDAHLAAAELDRALDIVDALGLHAFTPQIHLARAQLAEATGDDTARRTELRTAYDQFLEVGAYGRAEALASLLI